MGSPFTMFSHLTVIVLVISSVFAKPTVISDSGPDTQAPGVSELRPEEVKAFLPFLHFSQAVYCPSEQIKNWTCGLPCNKIKNFLPTLTGGDGGTTQYYFVGYWIQAKAVVVSHQGTDPSSLNAIFTDINLLHSKLDYDWLSGVPDDVLLHDGFATVHAKTALKIVLEVKRLLKQAKAKKVYVTGHSLGGAISTLDALVLASVLPKDVQIKTVTFGMPRVGNAAFVKYFDEKVHDYTRIINRDDVIPALPPRLFGYEHTKGEIRVVSNETVVRCPGNEFANDTRCYAGAVPDWFRGNPGDHLGPYPGGFRMGSFFCESEEESRSEYSQFRDTFFDLTAKISDGTKPLRDAVVAAGSFLSSMLLG